MGDINELKEHGKWNAGRLIHQVLP